MHCSALKNGPHPGLPGKILIQHRKRNNFAQFRSMLNYPPLTGLDGIIQYSDQPNGLGGRYAAARTRNIEGSSPYTASDEHDHGPLLAHPSLSVPSLHAHEASRAPPVLYK